jgi:hypothetical protein
MRQRRVPLRQPDPHRRSAVLEHPRGGDHGARLGQGQDLFQLMLAVLHGHGRNDQTELQAGQVDHVLLDRVDKLHDDDVVALQAQPPEAHGQLVDIFGQLRVGQAARRAVGQVCAVRRVHHRLALRVARHHLGKARVQRARAPPTLGGVLGNAFRRSDDHGQRFITASLT